MKLEIDLNSKEEIKKAIDLLQDLLGEKTPKETVLDRPLEDLEAKRAAMGIFAQEKSKEEKSRKQQIKEAQDRMDDSDLEVVPY